ncbi:putative Mediator of RNA polymerase II transcription subunit 22 [Glarea lozoyensis 74030]|uniref:Putative Mediator of RNA polymerase II transcription subunit 22 n=1 Tax=Glarea lozoyensis (strain ATCC 74030 / MF5533) TaxID=1104152 RepID=H0EJ88_GLAL7|nr:putative Mediator of RNA polymerase II transcription subunit 22 [Glarea lozoyensis 74030]
MSPPLRVNNLNDIKPHAINDIDYRYKRWHPSAQDPFRTFMSPPLNREGKYTADMLTRFRNLVMLANSQKSADDNGSKASREVAASEALAMEVETRALVRAAEDLLQLTREMKELWLFGPLREIGEGEGEGKMDEDSVKVGEMVEQILRKDAESSKSKLAG